MGELSLRLGNILKIKRMDYKLLKFMINLFRRFFIRWENMMEFIIFIQMIGFIMDKDKMKS